MRRASLLVMAACAGPPAGLVAPDAPPLVPVEGGTLDSRCGYRVTTPFGVSAPEWSQPVSGDDPTPIQIHLGITGDPATTMVVTWRTADDRTLAGGVDYGEGDALDRHAEAMTWLYYPYGAGPTRIHEAHLCDLEPDTRYAYRVGAEAGWSSVLGFRTAPAAGADDEVVVALLGDTRDGWDVWQSALEALDALAAPDLILFTGDAVDRGLNQAHWDRFFSAGEAVLSRVPMLTVLGNHEGNDAVYFAQLALPGDEQNYALDYGPLHLTVLNDLPNDVNDIGGPIAEFLEADLGAAAGRPWRVVSHHRPIWSSSLLHGSNAEIRQAWEPIFDAHRVDLVVNGHDHGYERTLPLRGGVPVEPGQGTVYLVTAGAGANLYESGSDFFTAHAESTHHFVILRARPGSLRFSAHTTDGSMIDALSF